MNLNLKKYPRFIPFLFFSALSSIFITEGLGLPYGRNISYSTLIIFPFILFFIDSKIVKKKWEIPSVISALFALFLALSFISTIFSINVLSSLSFFLLYFSLFMWFLYVYNNKEILNKQIEKFILIFSLVFSFYAYLLLILSKLQINFLLPETGYQLVFSTYGHSHLGDFLIISIILCVNNFYIYRKKLYIILASVFFCFFIFSFSRSAYIVLLTLVSLIGFYSLWTKRKKRLQVFLTIFFIGVISIVLFIATFKESERIIVIGDLHNYLQNNFSLKPKYLPYKRLEYIYESIESLKERSFIGFGPQNFIYISQKYTKTPYSWTDSSHNIFMDVFVENGIFAGIIFLSIILIICFKGKKNVLFILLLGLLLTFQVDYTHRIYSMFLLFFILGGYLYSEEKKNYSHLSLQYLSIFFILLLCINTLLQTVYSKESLIEKVKYSDSFRFYSYLYSGDSEVAYFMARTYKDQKNISMATYYYAKSYNAQPFTDFNRIVEIYSYLKMYKNKEIADNFMDSFFKKLLLVSNSSIYTQREGVKIKLFCANEKEYICP